MSHIATADLASLAGITKRQIQRMLAQDPSSVPGAVKTAGGHWQIPDSPAVRKWAANFKPWAGKPRSEIQRMETEETARILKSIGRSARKECPPVPPQVRARKTAAHGIPDKPPDDIVAVEIARQHVECDRLLSDAVKAIDAALNARLELSRVVDTAFAREGRTSRFLKWWKIQGLPVGWAEKYMRLARADGRQIIGDKNLLRLCGILPGPDASDSPREKRELSAFLWFNWAGKIRATLTSESIKAMGSIDRQVAANQLEPLADILRQLKSSRHP